MCQCIFNPVSFSQLQKLDVWEAFKSLDAIISGTTVLTFMRVRKVIIYKLFSVRFNFVHVTKTWIAPNKKIAWIFSDVHYTISVILIFLQKCLKCNNTWPKWGLLCPVKSRKLAFHWVVKRANFLTCHGTPYNKSLGHLVIICLFWSDFGSFCTFIGSSWDPSPTSVTWFHDRVSTFCFEH